MFQKAFLKTSRVKRFRSGMIALCAIGAILLATSGPLPLLANPGTVTVRVDPPTRAVPVNGTFTVDIVADGVSTEMNPNGLGAYEFDVTYDNGYVEVVAGGVADAGDLGATGRSVAGLGPTIDNPGGQTTFAAYSYPPLDTNGPVSDTVVLATVTLTATRAGVTTLNLANALLTDTQANVWPDGGAGRVLNAQGADIRGYTVGGNFDIDIKADPAVWKFNRFYWLQSSNNHQRTSIWLGWSDATPVPADYDGDGELDPAVWRSSVNRFVVKLSDSNYEQWSKWLGWPGAIPVPADYDGDGKADPAVWKFNRFYYLQSNNNYQRTSIWLGWSDATPVPADYDGDGKADPAVWRSSVNRFIVRLSGSNYQQWEKWLGWPGAIPVPADYDGDGKADPAVWKFNRFYYLQSNNNYQRTSIWLGWSDATPQPADYDGDGKVDPAVWRSSVNRFVVKLSGSGYEQWSKWLGWAGAIPVTY